MGEIAEMMLDGTMCQVCGEFMGFSVGYPVTCTGCQPEGDEILGAVSRVVTAGITKRTMECSELDCHRKFTTHTAYLQHWRAKHDPVPDTRSEDD